MGWAKYDEDNRDFIEERMQSMDYKPLVFNYTSGYDQQKGRGYGFRSSKPTPPNERDLRRPGRCGQR